MSIFYDLVIVGGGMVGLSLAKNMLDSSNQKQFKIAIIEKESNTGVHSSGRNSGVLHAGLYYPPNSIKAKVCVKGKRRLEKWVKDNGLSYNHCGKIIVAQDSHLDNQLDLIAERGHKNGANVELWNEHELKAKLPIARSASGRAVWTPDTTVVNPKEVISVLTKEVIAKGVHLYTNQKSWKIDVEDKNVVLEKGDKFKFGYLVNCAGIHAKEIATVFGVGQEFSVMPFKGLYWQINHNSSINIGTNLYPVPDLEVPFLGVHFTPSSDNSTISIGPTATLAVGKESYQGFEKFEPLQLANIMKILLKQYTFNEGNIRKYVHEQAFLWMKDKMMSEAKKLVPSLKSEDVEISSKIGIRSQLFNHSKNLLENDFIYRKGESSLHILNAISPAFTASFELADYIVAQTNLLDEIK